jgi:hypothetical protein
MTTKQTQNPNAITPYVDGFSDSDPSASPLKGTAIKFTDGDYFSFGDQIDVQGKSYAVLDRAKGCNARTRLLTAILDASERPTDAATASR